MTGQLPAGADTDALDTALRVLSALNVKADPNPVDVTKLRSLCPSLSGAALDELACDVIQQALRSRRQTRKNANAS